MKFNFCNSLAQPNRESPSQQSYLSIPLQGLLSCSTIYSQQSRLSTLSWAFYSVQRSTSQQSHLSISLLGFLCGSTISFSTKSSIHPSSGMSMRFHDLILNNVINPSLFWGFLCGSTISLSTNPSNYLCARDFHLVQRSNFQQSHLCISPLGTRDIYLAQRSHSQQSHLSIFSGLGTSIWFNDLILDKVIWLSFFSGLGTSLRFHDLILTNVIYLSLLSGLLST